MKLIIDIPDEEYKTLSKMSEKEKINELSYYERIIANGTPYNPTGNCISREALKNDISERLCDKSDKWNKTITVPEFETVVIDAIDNAPAVEPEVYMNSKDYNLYLEGYKQGKKDFERPQGEWGQCYENYKNGMFYRDCSICGKATITGDWKFCPYCGAEMKGGAE